MAHKLICNETKDYKLPPDVQRCKKTADNSATSQWSKNSNIVSMKSWRQPVKSEDATCLHIQLRRTPARAHVSAHHDHPRDVLAVLHVGCTDGVLHCRVDVWIWRRDAHSAAVLRWEDGKDAAWISTGRAAAARILSTSPKQAEKWAESAPLQGGGDRGKQLHV